MSVLRGTFRLSLVVAAMAVLASPVLAATMTADELLTMYRSGNEANRTVAGYWINGFILGVMASSVNGGQDGKPIICPNPNVVIGQEFVVENMESLLRDRPYLKTIIWPLVAFTALREAFPCK
jgi:hypothetical protein